MHKSSYITKDKPYFKERIEFHVVHLNISKWKSVIEMICKNPSK